MAKQGFKGQWVPITRAGKFLDSEGIERDLSPTFLKAVVSNYNASDHEAPAVVGHPKEDTPAFGWVSEVRLNDGDLEARFSDTDDSFEQLVEQGRFKKRSAAFYIQSPNPHVKTPTIKHVGFLGAATPAVKGLRDIQFAEGESFVLEDTFNLQEKNMGLEDTDVERVSKSVFEKMKDFFKPAESEADQSRATTAQFSEASVKGLIADAVKTVKEEVTTEFTEKLTEKDDELKALRAAVDGQTTSGRRSEIVSFVESIPAEKGKHFLKRAGVVEFMESLAVADAADQGPAIHFSEGDDEHKFSRLEWFKNYVDSQKSFVQFGEQFGNLKATAAATVEAVNPDEIEELRAGMGVSAAATGGEK